MNKTYEGKMCFNPNTKIKVNKLKRLFLTDDPSWALALNLVHGFKIIGATRLDGYHNLHFAFKSTKELDEHSERWNRVARDDCSGYENLFMYMGTLLNDFERDHFTELLGDLSTYDPAVHQ
jgi:hypothetical protein